MSEECEEVEGGKLRMVKELMNSRRTTSAVLSFIAVTQTGQRGQRQKQEKERQEKGRDEA